MLHVESGVRVQVAVQSLNADSPEFRVVGSGVVVEVDQAFRVVKKLKLVGTPTQVFKKTAFITGMFSSALEVARFEGATLSAVSGIRGVVKKALRAPPGAFRATFEDKILASGTTRVNCKRAVNCILY